MMNGLSHQILLMLIEAMSFATLVDLLQIVFQSFYCSYNLTLYKFVLQLHLTVNHLLWNFGLSMCI